MILRQIARTERNSLNFATGTAGYVNVTFNPQTALGLDDKPSADTGKFTIAWWMYQRSTGAAGSGRILQGTGIDVFCTGTNGLIMGNNGSNRTCSNNIFSTNRWTHITITFDKLNVKFYRNGELYYTVGQTNSPYNTSDITIGNSAAGTRCLDGHLKNLIILKNLAATEGQVSAIYQGVDPHMFPQLVNYYKFEEGTGTTVADDSGKGNTGTITGVGPAWSMRRPFGINSLRTDI